MADKGGTKARLEAAVKRLETAIGHMPELHTHPSNDLVTLIFTTYVEGYISGKPSKAVLYLALTEDSEVAHRVEKLVSRIEDP